MTANHVAGSDESAKQNTPAASSLSATAATTDAVGAILKGRLIENITATDELDTIAHLALQS